MLCSGNGTQRGRQCLHFVTTPKIIVEIDPSTWRVIYDVRTHETARGHELCETRGLLAPQPKIMHVIADDTVVTRVAGFCPVIQGRRAHRDHSRFAQESKLIGSDCRAARVIRENDAIAAQAPETARADTYVGCTRDYDGTFAQNRPITIAWDLMIGQHRKEHGPGVSTREIGRQSAGNQQAYGRKR